MAWHLSLVVSPQGGGGSNSNCSGHPTLENMMAEAYLIFVNFEAPPHYI